MIANDHSIFLRGLCVYVWVNILILSPLRVKNNPLHQPIGRWLCSGDWVRRWTGVKNVKLLAGDNRSTMQVTLRVDFQVQCSVLALWPVNNFYRLIIGNIAYIWGALIHCSLSPVDNGLDKTPFTSCFIWNRYRT